MKAIFTHADWKTWIADTRQYGYNPYDSESLEVWWYVSR